MKRIVRRIRGALGMGLIWGFVWSIPGTIPRWVLGMNPDAPFPLIFAALGLMAGVLFSILLTLAEGRKNFEAMSSSRFALWGAVGGFALAGAFGTLTSLGLRDLLLIAPAFAAASAVCSSGSLALARRAERGRLSDGDQRFVSDGR